MSKPIERWGMIDLIVEPTAEGGLEVIGHREQSGMTRDEVLQEINARLVKAGEPPIQTL